MKISLFQGILFGVFGLAALIGLFVFATYSSNGTGGDAVGPVVIWGTLPSAGMQAAIISAAKTETTLKGVTYVEKNPDTLPTDLATAIATGSAPDLILASQEELRALSKFISPIASSMLSPATFTNAFIKEGNLFAAPDGYYGIPFLIDPLVLFSNRTTLSSNGIVKPPATWEAMIGLVPNVSVLTPSRQITRALVALGSYDNVRNARGILSTLFLQTGVPISSYSSGSVIKADLGNNSYSGSGVPAGQSVLGFYTQFADPSKVSYTWNASLQDSQQMFLSGDLALYLGYASEARFLASANPNLDFAVSSIPQRATATTKNVYGLVYAFMIPNGAKNASGAYQAAVLFTNPDEQIAAVSATGLAPATLSTLEKGSADPVLSIAYSEALYASGWLSPASTDTDTVFSSMINNVINGRSTPATALTSAETSLSALLQR